MIAKFAFPLRVENGKFVTNEQDSTEEITDCVHVLLRTTTGTRTEKPDFGIDDHTFEENAATLQRNIERQIEKFEPRASVLVSEDDTQLSDLIVAAQVRMKEDHDG